MFRKEFYFQQLQALFLLYEIRVKIYKQQLKFHV